MLGKIDLVADDSEGKNKVVPGDTDSIIEMDTQMKK